MLSSSLRHILPFLLFFFLCAGSSFSSFAQPNKQKSVTKFAAPKDTLAPVSIVLDNNCNQGMFGLQLVFGEGADTFSKPNYLHIVGYAKNQEVKDSLGNKVPVTEIIPYNDVKLKGGLIYPGFEGDFVVMTAILKNDAWIFSKPSNVVSVNYCSSILFSDTFNTSLQKYYIPIKLVNIQIIEFTIFDRVGATAYIHNNNDIAWNAKFPGGGVCLPGIYYYHCVYQDLALGGELKTLSGMIEIKN